MRLQFPRGAECNLSSGYIHKKYAMRVRQVAYPFFAGTISQTKIRSTFAVTSSNNFDAEMCGMEFHKEIHFHDPKK